MNYRPRLRTAALYSLSLSCWFPFLPAVAGYTEAGVTHSQENSQGISWYVLQGGQITADMTSNALAATTLGITVGPDFFPGHQGLKLEGVGFQGQNMATLGITARSMSIRNSDLTYTGSTQYILSANSYATLTIQGSTVTSSGGGLNLINTNSALSDFTLNTADVGIMSNWGTQTTLTDGSLSTSKNLARGLWALSGDISSRAATITGHAVNIDTSGRNAHAVEASGSYATISLHDSNITTGGTLQAGDTAYGLFADQGGKISLGSTAGQRSSVKTTGNQSTAVIAANTSDYRISVVDLTGVDVFTHGDSGYGLRLVSRGDTTARVTLQDSTVKTYGSNAYGAFVQNGGLLYLRNGSHIDTQGANAHGLVYFANASHYMNTVSMENSSIHSAQGAAVFAAGGKNTLNLDQAALSGSLLAYAGANTSQPAAPVSSALNIEAINSQLTGGTWVESGSTLSLALKNSSYWTLTAANAGASQVSTLTLDDSTLDFASPSAPGAYQALQISNDLTLTGSPHIRLNTWLNAGGALSNQQTDRLLIQGDVIGTASVKVVGTANSPGGQTSPDASNRASEGISVIQVGGLSTENTFSLHGGYVALGGLPYEYRLYAYGPGSSNGAAEDSQRLISGQDPFWDYRLQSVYTGTAPIIPPDPDPDPNPPPAQREVVPQVPAYLLAPVALFQAGQADIGTLHRRLGDYRDDPQAGRLGNTGEIFMRGYGGNYRHSTDLSKAEYGHDARISYSAIQAGSNLYTMQGTAQSLRLGAAISTGTLSFNPRGARANASGRADTWALSGYASWQNPQGWYVDGVVSAGGFSGRVSTDLRGQTARLKGSQWAVSAETGWQFDTNRYGLMLEPQLQLMYQQLQFRKRADIDGFPIDFGHQSLWTARAGVRLSQSTHGESAWRQATFGVKLNVLHSLGKSGHVDLGENFAVSGTGTSAELGIDANLTATRQLSLYLDAAWRRKIATAGTTGLTLAGGIRYSF